MKLRLLILSLLVFVGIIVASPYVLKSIAQNQLEGLGATQISIEDIDLNFFTGILSIKNLSFSSKTQESMHVQLASIDLDWLPLTKQRLFIKTIILNGLDVDIEVTHKKTLRIGGLSLPNNAKEETNASPSNWMFALQNVSIESAELHIKMAQENHRIQIKSAQLGHMIQWFPGDAATLNLEARINGSPLNLSTDLSPFNKQPVYNIDFVIENFDLSIAQAFLSNIKNIKGYISAHSQLKIQQLDNQIRLTHTGDLAINNFSVDLKNNNIQVIASTDQFNLTGTTQANLGNNMAFATQSQLNFKTLSYFDHTKDIAINLSSARLSGKANYNAKDQPTYSTELDVELSKLAIIKPKSKLNVLTINNITISQLHTDESQSLTVAKTLLKDIAVAPENKKYLSRIKQLSIDNLQIMDQRLIIDEIALSGGQSVIAVDKQGEWNFDTFLQRLSDAENVQNKMATIDTPKTSAKKDLTFNIKKITIKDNYLVRYHDAQTTPPFALKTTVAEFNINQLDSLNVEKPALINLDATLENYGKVNIFSELYPFKPKLSATIKTKISGLDLPIFSSYMAPALGVQIKSGLLTSKIDLNIKNDMLDGIADITLEQFTMSELSKEQKKKLDEGADLSLNTSLEMLRDKNNRIHLEIPVTGDIHSPDFNANDVIKQATAKAAKAGAIKYLTQTLQPYGSFITIVKFAGKQLTKVRLKPIEFQSQSDTLTTDAQSYLKKVALILKERPKIAIRLCGFSSQNEFTPPPATEKTDDIDPQTFLLNLAKTRAEKVKSYLIETLHAPSERLVGCLPEIDTKKENAGRVDLYI